MDKIIWYNHTFSNTNIKPAFVDIEIIGSVIYHAYYFILYPTGLAIVLAVPNELASISYNPYTNYFTTADSLSGGMVKLASVTPKIYQFVGASQILVSAGAWSPLHSETSSNAHYKWYGLTVSNNPISLNTSTKRIIWRGTEYGTLPEMLFIDPALWMWQTLSTDSVDTIRYPLYKKNNLYYKSTSTKETNAQYLSAAGDAFSHDGPMWSYVNQDWTRGYASKNKLGILLNSEVRNPVVPSNNNNFTEVTDNSNTKDIYQWDDKRYMSERYGIKDGTDSYQLSFSPASSIAGAEGFRLNYYVSPDTTHSRNNPWKLWDKNEDINLDTDIFRIDQFVLQIKGSQYKIPIGWNVHIYQRTGGVVAGSLSTIFKVGHGTTWNYEPYLKFVVAGTARNDGDAAIILTSVNCSDGSEGSAPFWSHNFGGTMKEFVLNQSNSLIEQQNVNFSKTDIRIDQKLKINSQPSSGMSFQTNTGGKYTWITPNWQIWGGGPGEVQFQFVHDIKQIPYPPGFLAPTDQTIITEGYSHSGSIDIIYWPDREQVNQDGWIFDLYIDRKQQILGSTEKRYARIVNNINYLLEPGIIANNASWKTSLIKDPSYTTITVYTDSSHNNTTTLEVAYGGNNNGNVYGWDVDLVCNGATCNTKTWIVAYPES